MKLSCFYFLCFSPYCAVFCKSSAWMFSCYLSCFSLGLSDASECIVISTSGFIPPNLKKVSINKCDIDGQSEITMWPSRPEVLIPQRVWQNHYNSDGKPGVFDHARPRAKKLTPVDCDNDRQPEIAIWTFCSPILQFLAVGCCRNHLANLLWSSTSSKIPNLALQFRRYLSEFQRCNYFRFGGHIDISGCPSLLYLLANIILTYTWSYTPDLSLEF